MEQQRSYILTPKKISMDMTDVKLKTGQGVSTLRELETSQNHVEYFSNMNEGFIKLKLAKESNTDHIIYP